MKTETPRLRMFAGPNGSGKSTLKSTLNSKILGVYINPDEIEKEIQQRDFLDLSAYGVVAEQQEILDFFLGSLLLKKAGLLDEAEALCFSDNKRGHPVPEEKIISRFSRSLDLLMDAIACSDRAYIFDNSGKQQVWIAEITDGKWLEMKTENMPNWFFTAVLDKAKP